MRRPRDVSRSWVAGSVTSAPATGVGSPVAVGSSASYRSETVTGVKVSLVALLTPCAPTVITPQVTSRQSMVRDPPLRSKASKTAPGTVRVADQAPVRVIVACAEEEVSEPGKATNCWKPWLSRDSLSGT